MMIWKINNFFLWFMYITSNIYMYVLFMYHKQHSFLWSVINNLSIIVYIYNMSIYTAIYIYIYLQYREIMYIWNGNIDDDKMLMMKMFNNEWIVNDAKMSIICIYIYDKCYWHFIYIYCQWHCNLKYKISIYKTFISNEI